MKNKKWILPLGILVGLCLLCGGILLYMSINSLGLSVGRCLIAQNGSHMIILEERSPISMSNVKGKTDLFEGLENGDKILVLHDGIQESYPGKTGVYAVFKLEDGDISDIPEQVLKELEELGRWTNNEATLKSFSLTFDTYGTSSYDSSTGRLVKTTHATNPEDYVTTMFLEEEQWNEVSELLGALDMLEYPDTYDPINAPDAETITMSEPSMTLILTVKTDRWAKTVACRNIAYQYTGYNEAAQSFLDVCKRLQEMITSTEEWKALPEYEYFYE